MKMSIVGNSHLYIIFCGMFLSSNSMHEFLQDSLAFSTNMLPTVKFEVSKSLDNHTPPAFFSREDTITPSEELKKAGQELRLGLNCDFLGPKVNKPIQIHTTDTTHPQRSATCASGSSHFPDAWGTSSTMDCPYLSSHSRFGCIHTNSNFQIPLELSLMKTLASHPPSENCIINPKRKIDVLIKSGTFSLSAQTKTNNSKSCSAAPSSEGQAGLKKLWVNTSKHVNLDLHKKPIFHHLEAPGYQKEKLFQPSLIYTPKIQDSQQLETTHSISMNMKSEGRSTKQRIDFTKPPKARPNPFQTGAVSSSNTNMKQNLSKKSKLHSTNTFSQGKLNKNLKNKFLLSHEPKLKSLDFDVSMIVVEDPNPITKQNIEEFFKSITAGTEGKIVLKFENASAAFDKLERIYQPEQAVNIKPRSFSCDLIRVKVQELVSNQDQWFNFWSKRTNIKFEDVLKDEMLVSENRKKLLQMFLFYVNMVDSILPPSKTIPKLAEYKSKLFKDALNIFQEFRLTSPEYKDARVENAGRFNKKIPALIWHLVYFWIERVDRSDLKALAFSSQDKINQKFKIFFNTVFKFSSGNLNMKLKRGPNISQFF